MNRIIIVSLDNRFKKKESVIRKDAREILKILKKDGVALEIYLAGERLMRQLNKKYRGKDRAANVLSFIEPKEFSRAEYKEKFLGEVFLNASHPEPKAKDLGDSSLRSAPLRMTYLLVHAVLHLLGFTHKKKGDRIKMEKKEKYVLYRLRHWNIAN